MNAETSSYAFLAVFVGALSPIQFAVNSMLGRGIGGPIAATLVSFLAGLIVLTCLNALVFREWPSVAQFAAQPWPVLLIGGSIGVVFVSANVFLTPRLGAAAMLTFVMAGQLACALAIDKIGLFGIGLRDLSAGRIGGVLLVLIGALMVRLN